MSVPKIITIDSAIEALQRNKQTFLCICIISYDICVNITYNKNMMFETENKTTYI